MSYMHYYNVWYYFKYTPNIQHTRLSIKYEYLNIFSFMYS